MVVPDWSTAWTLETDAGTLDLFDGSTLDGFEPIAEQCDVGAEVRVNTEPVPQGDGSVFHRRFRAGMVLHFTANVWKDGAIAMGTDRQELVEELALHLNALQNSDGRLIWSLPDGGERMLDRIRILERPGYQGSLLKQITFAVESPFPYALTHQEQELATITSSLTITNNGDCDTYPVWKVNGASTGFTLTNTTTGLAIVYDDGLPGASSIASGHYVEIDTFRNTAWLDGDAANRKAGIDLLQTDFFPLVPGDNDIEITGATVDALVNDAFR